MTNANTVPVVSAPPPPTTVPPSTPPAGAPTAVALDPLNVRSGPGNAYPSFGVATTGSTAEIIGVSPDGSWWVVRIPTSIAANGQGWVTASAVSATNASGVPVIQPPPVP